MPDLFIVFAAFFYLPQKFFGAFLRFFLRGHRLWFRQLGYPLRAIGFGSVDALELLEIVDTDATYGVGVEAVHVNERLKPFWRPLSNSQQMGRLPEPATM